MNETTRPATYHEEVAQYTKKDAIHALLYAAYLGLFGVFVWWFNVAFGFFVDGEITFAGQLIGLPMVLLLGLAPALIILKKKGQTLRSVGLHLTNWKKSLLAGLCFIVIIIILASVLPGLFFGWRLASPAMIIWLVVYLLIMAFWEDVVFIGFIQTRIYGLVEKDFWAIALGGFLFAAVHYPNLFIRHFSDGGLFDFDLLIWVLTITLGWIMLHVAFNYTFRGFRSIIPVTLLHISANMAMRADLWYYTGGSSHNEFMLQGITMFAAFFIIPAIFLWRKKQTAK